MSFLRFFLFFIALSGLGQPVWSQVRLFQWTDVHSTLETMGRQVLAIDLMAREFKAKNPGGEVVVYIIGDFTSLNVYASNYGWLSLEAMKLLRDRGYTVLFTPGNHDAFDWINKPGDIELFIKQMQTIQGWGVKILAGNYISKTPLMDSLLTFSYPLKTVDTIPHIVGLTLDRLFRQSNLYEEEAQKLFRGVENYQQALDKILPQLSRQGVESVILGVHENNRRVSNILKSRNFEKSFGVRIPLALAAHDHLIATYYEKGKGGGRTMVSDAGSHGSFSVIDILRNGEVSEALTHIAISSRALMQVVNKDTFYIGKLVKNPVTEADIENSSWPRLHDYHRNVRNHLSNTKNQLDRVLVTLENDINETKQNLKRGRSHLGDMVAESLARWGRSLIPVPGKNRRQSVIAMFNSSSYRLEEPLLKGPLTELIIHEIYPYLIHATLYKIKGWEIERLYFSLKRDYKIKSENKDHHTPQINPDFREFDGRLQVKTSKGWMNIRKNKKYYLALDSWLSLHRFGRGYRVPGWKFLEGKEVLHTRFMVDILIDFFPQVLKENDRRQKKSKNKRGKSGNPLNHHFGRGKKAYQTDKKRRRRRMVFGCETLFYKAP